METMTALELIKVQGLQKMFFLKRIRLIRIDRTCATKDRNRPIFTSNYDVIVGIFQ